MKFKRIMIENFAGIKSFASDLYDTTLISGANETGKSTIRNAITWVLYDKMADGASATAIRPHDENGKDIDMVDISVTLTIENDGEEYELKKVQSQKWVKQRGSDNRKFQGNENNYFVSDIPKAEKDYKAIIEGFVDLDTLLFGTNAQSFLKLDTKKRREKLLTLERDFSDEAVAGNDKDFQKIVKQLKIGTIDELITRAKKAIKGFKDEQKAIPVRIDELSKQISETDIGVLESQASEIEQKIQKASKCIEDKKKGLEKANADYMRIEFDISDRQRVLVEEANKDKRELEDRLTEIEIELVKTKGTLERELIQIDNHERSIAQYQEDIKAIEEQIARTEKTPFSYPDFDENTTVCPTCGQNLPKEDIENLKAEHVKNRENAEKVFNEARDKTIKDFIEKIKNINELINSVSDDSGEVKDIENKVKELEKRKEKIQKEIDKQDTTVDFEADKEIKNLAKRKNVMEVEIEKNYDTTVEEVELESLKKQLSEARDKLAVANENKALMDRIDELRDRQMEVSQKIADEEKELDTLDRFNRAKMEMLTDKINSHFKTVKFKLFKTLINGGTELICEPEINGSSYFGLLNHGNKLLAEMEICKAFQDVADTKLPIFIDDAESVDEWRIPELDRQLICLRRTDNKELNIKEI